MRFRKRAVPKTGFYGTEYACCAQKGFLGYATHLQRPAEQPTPQTVDRLLPHRTHLQCAKRPPLSLFAPAPSTISFVPLTRNLSPAAPSLAPSTALGTRNGPRSEVSRHKEEADPFWSTSSRKVILIYRRHGRHTVNFVSSFVEKREMLTLTSSLSGER